MKVKAYRNITNNSGKISKDYPLDIIIKRGRWIKKSKNEEISHPLKYEQYHCFEDKYVYFFYKFGAGTQGVHVPLTWFQNQRFRLIQGTHWLQKNYKYVLGIIINSFVKLIYK